GLRRVAAHGPGLGSRAARRAGRRGPHGRGDAGRAPSRGRHGVLRRRDQRALGAYHPPMQESSAMRMRRAPTPENRLGLDYRTEAARFARFDAPLIDAHTHINGDRAVRIYQEARALYGVALTYSMTPLRHA